MKVSEINSLLTRYPEIAKSIDFDATMKAWNKDSKKYAHVTCLEDCLQIAPKTNKRAIFKCLKNPEHDNWDTTINSRTSFFKCGCPQCAGQVASKENNLLVCYPEVAKSIDFGTTIKAWKKNPKKYAYVTCLEDCSKITPGTHKRAIFKCLKNLEHDNWDVVISNRTNRGRGCPQCAVMQRSKSLTKTKLKNNNNLLVCYPEVAKSINFDATIKAWNKDPKRYAHITCLEDCSKITPNTHKRAIFKCLKNSEHNSWDTRINDRTGRSRSCPECAGHKASKENNLLTCYPEVAKSIDFDATMKAWNKDPKKYAHLTCLEDCSKITSASGKRVIFKCLKNAEHDNWDTRITNRTSLNNDCPQCFGRVASKENNLLTCYPEVAKSIDFDATMKVWNKDPKKYAYLTCLEDCSKITSASGKRVIFKCLKNAEHDNWGAQISRRTSSKRGCPQCGLIQRHKSYIKARLKNNNNLLVCYPEVAKSIDFSATIKAWKQNPKKYVYATCLEDCSKITPKTDKRAIFKCLKNPKHGNWDVQICARTCSNCNCPQCAIRNVSQEEKIFRKELVKKLQLKNNEYETNVRIIPSFNKNSKRKLELDFVCEKLGIAVEFNGTYWHSDKVIRKYRGVSADFYHRYKFEQAKKLGLTLLFVREQDWLNNKDAVLAAIKNYCLAYTEIPEILRAYI